MLLLLLLLLRVLLQTVEIHCLKVLFLAVAVASVVVVLSSSYSIACDFVADAVVAADVAVGVVVAAVADNQNIHCATVAFLAVVGVGGVALLLSYSCACCDFIAVVLR